jgi:hypothetical protein
MLRRFSLVILSLMSSATKEQVLARAFPPAAFLGD